MTYTTIYGLGSRQSLLTKTAASITMAATYVVGGGGSPTTSQRNNAKTALQDPMSMAKSFIWYVVNDATVQSQENAAPDSATDAAVRAVVDANWPNIWS